MLKIACSSCQSMPNKNGQNASIKAYTKLIFAYITNSNKMMFAAPHLPSCRCHPLLPSPSTSTTRPLPPLPCPPWLRRATVTWCATALLLVVADATLVAWFLLNDSQCESSSIWCINTVVLHPDGRWSSYLLLAIEANEAVNLSSGPNNVPMWCNDDDDQSQGIIPCGWEGGGTDLTSYDGVKRRRKSYSQSLVQTVYLGRFHLDWDQHLMVLQLWVGPGIVPHQIKPQSSDVGDGDCVSVSWDTWLIHWFSCGP